MPGSHSASTLAISHSLICFGVLVVTPSLLLSSDSPLDPAPRQFLERDLASLTRSLEAHRLPALTREERAQVIRSLPTHGEVTRLSPSDRNKLQCLQPLLGSSEHQAYEVKVIDVPQVFSGLYERTVLLISAPALSLWTPEELQAIAAHELGHDYVWADYQAALNHKQQHRLQQLELYCDGIAILNLQRLAIDPSRLIEALDKGVRYNRRRLGRALNEGNYPDFGQRRQFHRALIRRMR